MRPSPRLHWILRTGWEFRQQTDYPPSRRLALVTLKACTRENPPSANHMRQALEQATTDLSSELFWPSPCASGTRRKPLSISDPGAGPRMQRLSVCMAEMLQSLRLPEGVKVGVDIDPVNLC